MTGRRLRLSRADIETLRAELRRVDALIAEMEALGHKPQKTVRDQQGSLRAITGILIVRCCGCSKPTPVDVLIATLDSPVPTCALCVDCAAGLRALQTNPDYIQGTREP